MLTIIFIIFSITYPSLSVEECKRNFSIRKNAIILTKSSQAKGASFIHKQVVSRFPECYALCCSNPDCTVAVYENKVNHNCFLFNCKQPNICSFTEHAHYISMMYVKNENKPNTISNDNDDKSKSDLNKPSADGKLGELCGALRKCGPENSMCTSGTCICQIGFIGRNGECVRSLCPKPELMFQCYDVTKMPFCVALYDQCNRLYECGDGSDELNCEDRTNGVKPIITNQTTNMQPNKIERKIENQVPEKVTIRSNNQPKEQTNNEEHLHSENQNSSYWSAKLHNSMNHKSLDASRRINPLVENQLLVLESKNSLPKYPHPNNQPRAKSHRSYTKSQRETDSNTNSNNNNNQGFDNGRYSKLKTSLYPHLTKIDEYYQKNPPDSSDSSSRWSSPDSYYSDYDYPQMSVNSRNQNSDWLSDKGSSQYADSNYQDSPAKYPTDRNSYSDYTDTDDDVYSKPRGRYISDNDYYNPKNYLHKALEPSMDHKKLNGKIKEKPHRIFIKPNSKPNKIKKHSTSTSSNENLATNLDEIDGKNTQEWSTALIMLSFGLLITAALLIAIGIKMRSWRRKLRKGKKGKSLTTDEGDYLINGMYL